MSDTSKIQVGKNAEFMERVVRRLAFPRFSGTEHIQKAEEILLDECKQLKISPITETFQTSSFFMQRINQIPYFLLGVLVLITAILAIVNVSVILLLILAIMLIILSLAIEKIIRLLKYPMMYSKWAKQYSSHNFVLSPQSLYTDKVNLFFLAHLDSKSEQPHPHPLFLLIYVSAQVGTLVFAINLIVYAIYHLVIPAEFLGSSWVFVYGLVLGFFDMLRIMTKYNEGKSPGANDDAIGCAICLLLQQYFNANPLKNVNVIPVITGSEEVGEAGTYNFIKSKNPPLDKTKNHFIALDGITGKNIYYFPAQGLLKTPFSPLVLKGIEDLIRNKDSSLTNLHLIRMWMPPPVNTDHSPVVALGYPAFVLASPENVSHSEQDTPDKINYQEVESFVDFVIALIHQIDKNLV